MINSKTETMPTYDIESEVIRRYAEGAETVQPSLCCPTNYDANYLKIIPEEILQKDYGCGDPSKYLQEGDTVVDLGSGAGKICYILAQKVGAAGKVIGVDFNDAMIHVAKKYQSEIAETLGYDAVHFVKARIQDMALDLNHMQGWLQDNPIASVESMRSYEEECDRMRSESPLIATESVDAVVSNCVLNLVRPQDKVQLFQEIHRVLNRGGRAVISDIVCDEDPTPEILSNPELWSDCIAGAFREDRFLAMFEAAGFYGVEIMERQEQPWRVIDGIEFRSLTVRAWKGKEGVCLERNQAVVYQGPWKSVTDDDGHTYLRGQRMAVCDKTHSLLMSDSGPYANTMDSITPHNDIPLEKAELFDCSKDALRHPRVSKGEDYNVTSGTNDDGCADTGCC